MPVNPQGHILVVENNDITRKLIVGILNNKGYETYEAKSGDEALAFLGKQLTLMVLDVENDSIDNLGLLHKLKMEHSRLPVIALTDEADHKAVQERIGVPQVSILTKPVMPDKLLNNIQSHLLKGIEKKIEKETIPAAKPLAPDVRDPVDKKQQEEFMRRAIDISQEKMDANCGGPFGAVIVRGGKIVGEGWNEVTSTNDPTAHAEMVAIRNACKTIGNYSLEGCEIYTSCEPCPMCLSAIYWARLDRIYFGNTREDAERIGFDDDFIYREVALPEDKRTLPSKMFLREEAKIVFENWMKKQDKTPY
jgi:guanine deaminase